MKKDYIAFDDLQKVDLRVGEVITASAVEKSTKLLELHVDFGEDYGKVTVLTGMAKFYEPEYFVGKKFAFVANLQPRPMMGKESQGMIMACDAEEQMGKPILIEVPHEVSNGTVVR